MQRVFKDVTPGAQLHDPPKVHDGHPVADAFYDGHIMGNKEEGDAEFFLKGQKEVDDLGAYGHVEGGNGFVGNDDLRVHRQGAGDADALALPAGELMRITDGHCGVQIDALQQFPNPAFRFLP